MHARPRAMIPATERAQLLLLPAFSLLAVRFAGKDPAGIRCMS
jgi:hypothetical protein